MVNVLFENDVLVISDEDVEHSIRKTKIINLTSEVFVYGMIKLIIETEEKKYWVMCDNINELKEISEKIRNFIF